MNTPLIKSAVKKISGYSKLKTKLYNDFIRSILYPFALRGRISTEESWFLTRLVMEAETYPGPIIEVGTLFGYSTLVIVNAKAPKKKLITVDNFRWNPAGLPRTLHMSITREILSEAVEKHSVELLNTDKRDFYETYSLVPPCLAFFDANHSYEATLEDLLWAKKVKANIVAGHDYSSKHPGVIEAVREVFTDASLHVYDSLFAIRTRKKEL